MSDIRGPFFGCSVSDALEIGAMRARAEMGSSYDGLILPVMTGAVNGYRAWLDLAGYDVETIDVAADNPGITRIRFQKRVTS